MNRILVCLTLLWVSLVVSAQPELDFQQVTLTGPALVDPVDIASAGDGSGRLFIVEKRGTIRIIENDTVRSTFFLDLRPDIQTDGETGLLGLVFHPNFPSTPNFYINYVMPGQTTRIAKFEVNPANPDVAIDDSEKAVLEVSQPFNNHNAGDLAFGPDGYLYIALGDGGSGGDPEENGQDVDVLLGKILRIDVDSGDPYAIPPDNPFVGVPNAREEIWAWGMRNPWRFSFDRETGDLWIADVGQGVWEEIDFEPAGSAGGLNYGWDCYEGDADFESTGCTDESDYVFPVFVYPHNCNQGCPYGTGNSITGGFVYRGSQFPSMQGYYICVDYGSENIWLISHDGSTTEITQQSGTGFNQLTTFGEDENGELYAATLGDVLYRVVPDGFLPITLTHFDAHAMSSGVEVRWSLENVHEVAEFVLERSANGVYFKTLGKISPENGKDVYAYVDEAPFTGMNYYRLVTQLKDNKSQISPVRSVQMAGEQDVVALTRDDGGLGIQMKGVEEGAEVTVMTSDGRVVSGARADQNYYPVQGTELLPEGVYVVVVETPGRSWTLKWLKS